MMVHTADVSLHTGPLPDPATLKDYSEIHPDVLPFILMRTQTEQDERWKFVAQEQQNLVLAEGRAERTRLHGSYLGALLGLTGIVASVVCAWLNQPLVASVLGGGSLTSLVTVFVVGRGKRATEPPPPAPQDEPNPPARRAPSKENSKRPRG